MAFVKYARALVLSPSTNPTNWSAVRTATGKRANLVGQAEKIFGSTFNPEDYLLTHCTIVASVDAENVPNVKLGSVTENGKKVNRKYANYHITPSTSKYVNNNGDSWDRDVLMKSYQTFVGSHNFQEHVQIEDLSKGRIIDAVARDVGDSIYVDILVATDRKHTQLVEDIQSGRLGTLSMGCTVDSTICTKCGNVAVDDTDFCDHVKYEKRNTFIDSSGKKRIIAELCGHPDMGDTAGVTFIEASWVAVPAFTGAVMRNILSTDEISSEVVRKANDVLSVPPAEWSKEAEKKVARDVSAFGFDDDEEDEGGSEAPKSPIDELEDEMVNVVKKRVLLRLKNEFSPKEEKEKDENPPKPEDSTVYQNDTIIKEGALLREAHRMGQKLGVLQGIAKVSHTKEDFIDGIALLDSERGSNTSVSVYRASLKVGSVSKYNSLRNFLLYSKEALGGTMTKSEATQMIRLARLLDFWSAQNP